MRERVGHDRDLELREVPGHRPGRRGVAVVAAHRTDAGTRPDHADRDAQRGRADRRRVHGRAGHPTPTSSTSSARCPPRSITRAGSGTTCPTDGSVRFEVLGLGLTGLSVAGPRSRDVLHAVAPDLDLSTEAFPFMTFRQVDLGDDPGPPGTDQLRGRSRLRAVGRAGVPARALRPDHGSRRGARPATVRDARVDVAPAREELRDVVPRVPADLHAARGRASPATSSSTTTSSVARPTSRSWPPAARSVALVAFVVEPDPDDPADVIGDEPVWHDGEVVGWVTSGGYGHHVKQSIALGYVPDGAGHAGRPGRRGLRDRDHRPTASGAAPAGAAVRPGGPADAPVTDRPRGRPVDAGRIVVDGRPVAFEAGDSVAVADPADRRDARPAAARCAWPATAANCLAPGRWRRLRPDVPGAGAARARGRAPPAERPAAAPGDQRAGPRRAPPARTSRCCGPRSTSPSSVVARAGREAAATAERGGTGRSSWTLLTATRSSASTPGPTIVAARRR